jgi:ABC-type transport system involved in multi-copper enzyme maturation permease subunit
MTPLRGTDVVVAKGLAHGLRAMTLWLAVLPVLTIPFLLGGVSWQEALLSMLINLSAICWALAAGLLASAWSKQWLRALLRAAILEFCFLLLLGLVAGCALVPALTGGRTTAWMAFPSGSPTQFSWDYVIASGLGFITNVTGRWFMYLRVSSGSRLFWAMGEITVLSVLVLIFAILVAGSKTRRSWQDEPVSALRLWWEKTFCTPFVWVGLFSRWMRRKLERNPIGWLEQRTWTGRLVTWGWLAVIISLYTAVLTDRNFFRNYNSMQALMAWLLAGSVAMSAAGSFRRERETGVMELLLVSPLAANDIVSGRLRGLWSQFLPAVGLLLGVWAYISSLEVENKDAETISFYAITFLTLPIVGLYYSLRCRNFITAFLASLAVGLLLPVVLPAMLWFVWGAGNYNAAFNGAIGPSGRAAVVQLLLAALCWDRLLTRLKKRNFPLERTE